jgi:hypothetical protein
MTKIKTSELLGVEPGLVVTSIVDKLAVKPTKEEIKKLKEYGFESVSKTKTHFSNYDVGSGNDTIVKFVVGKDSYFLRLECDDYEFSLYPNINFLEVHFEKLDELFHEEDSE